LKSNGSRLYNEREHVVDGRRLQHVSIARQSLSALTKNVRLSRKRAHHEQQCPTSAPV